MRGFHPPFVSAKAGTQSNEVLRMPLPGSRLRGNERV